MLAWVTRGSKRDVCDVKRRCCLECVRVAMALEWRTPPHRRCCGKKSAHAVPRVVSFLSSHELDARALQPWSQVAAACPSFTKSNVHVGMLACWMLTEMCGGTAGPTNGRSFREKFMRLENKCDAEYTRPSPGHRTRCFCEPGPLNQGDMETGGCRPHYDVCCRCQMYLRNSVIVFCICLIN